MNALAPDFLGSLGLVLIAIGVVVAIVVVRLARARRDARGRVVEQPNSHYNSQLVRDSEKHHRWRGIALDRLHEINRGEVVRLLAKVEATSVEALRVNERTFLDHMAELAGTRPAAEPRAKDEPSGAPDLRPRHA